MADIEREDLVSWVLYAVRATFEEESTRNNILKLFLLDNPYIEYGRTFTGEYDERELYDYIRNVARQRDNIVLFTASNLPDIVSGETHFQTFIMDNRYKKVWIIDPARNTDGSEGIYDPIIGKSLIRTFTKNGFKVEWFTTLGSTCQINEKDVFCQSWSLYLQIRLVLDGEVFIPLDDIERYQLLLDFYQYLTHFDFFCTSLNHNYQEAIKNDLKVGYSRSWQEEVKYSYLKYYPCQILQSMTVGEML
jgi:hypothetical protein